MYWSIQSKGAQYFRLQIGRRCAACFFFRLVPDRGIRKITIEKIVSESAQFDNGEFRCRTKSANIIDIEAHTLSIAWKGCRLCSSRSGDVTERKMLEREQALYVWEQEKLSEIDNSLSA